MKKIILSLLGLCFFAASIIAQDTTGIIFNEEFDGGLGDWEVGPGDPVGAVWQWRSNAAPDSAFIDGVLTPARLTSTTDPMVSLTPENGAAVFNSDVYDSGGGESGEGPFPGMQTASLTSPSIDCSGFDNITLRFNQFAWLWNSTISSFLEISNDGGTTWTDFPINTDLTLIANTFSDDVQVLNISSVAANQSDVKIRFTWSGDMAFWLIDDVQVLETPDYDLDMQSFFYTPANYAQPVSQVGTDTMIFTGIIANKGKIDRTNVVFRASIINLSRSELVYEDSLVLETLPAFQDSVVAIENSYAPGDTLVEDNYLIIYEVFARDSLVDFNPLDNSADALFQVTPALYANEDGERGAIFLFFITAWR